MNEAEGNRNVALEAISEENTSREISQKLFFTEQMQRINKACSDTSELEQLCSMRRQLYGMNQSIGWIYTLTVLN